jgi:phosphate/sulfate permease
MHSLAAVMLADIGGLLLFPIGLLAIAFWVWMIVDCARHETGSTMLAWLLAILFAGIIAAPLYFLLRKLTRQRSARFHLASHLYQPWQKDQRIG